MTGMTRRSVLAGSIAVGAVAVLPGPVRAAAPDPFTLGVASGDPSHHGVVLWTRLATTPLAEDGMGGMPARPVTVEWELAADERFRRVVRRGRVQARPEQAHSVHVELAGLAPGRDYWYRFRTGRHVSPVGRTRTAPRPARSDRP